MKGKLFYILIITICLFGCHSNAIYFDIEQQTVVGCDGAISDLYIESKDYLDYLHFTTLPEKKSSRTFSLKELNKNYSVTIRGGNFDLNNFKLRPETEYEIINHSNGDAGGGNLLIRTDKHGVVIYASRTSCE